MAYVTCRNAIMNWGGERTGSGGRTSSARVESQGKDGENFPVFLLRECLLAVLLVQT